MCKIALRGIFLTIARHQIQRALVWGRLLWPVARPVAEAHPWQRVQVGNNHILSLSGNGKWTSLLRNAHPMSVLGCRGLLTAWPEVPY